MTIDIGLVLIVLGVSLVLFVSEKVRMDVTVLTGGVLSAFMNNIGVAVAMAASASFTSPISHPANLLVMGPGGYRFGDYLKLGLPLTIVVFVAVMVLLPLIWPLTLV